jgi:hypothetical protein
MTKKAKPKKPSKVATPVIGKDESKWMAEDDSRTLMRAEEIKRDRARLLKAKAYAKKQIEDLAKVAKA